MFRWKPEGRYRNRLSYSDSALLVLNRTSLNSDSALLALNWRYTDNFQSQNMLCLQKTRYQHHPLYIFLVSSYSSFATISVYLNLRKILRNSQTMEHTNEQGVRNSVQSLCPEWIYTAAQLDRQGIITDENQIAHYRRNIQVELWEGRWSPMHSRLCACAKRTPILTMQYSRIIMRYGIVG